MRVFLLIAFSMLLYTKQVNAASNIGVFMIVKGKVEVSKDNGKMRRARMGMKVYPKDIIQASKNARAKLVMIDKNVLNVSPDSKFQLTNYKYDKENNEKKVSIDLIYGKIRSKVKQKYDDKKQTYRVKTKAAVAGVRGTDFIVSHSNNKTDVITFSGAVSVGSQIDSNGLISNPVSVRPGQMTSISLNSSPRPPKEIPKSQLSNIDRDSDAEGIPTKEEDREPAQDNLPLDQEPGAEESESSDIEGDREPDANTMLPPPPPPPEEEVLDISYNPDEQNMPEMDEYDEINPSIDDIIQQSNTELNISIVAPQ